MEAAVISANLANTPFIGDSAVSHESNSTLSSTRENAKVPGESTEDNTFVIIRNAATLGLDSPLNTDIHLGK